VLFEGLFVAGYCRRCRGMYDGWKATPSRAEFGRLTAGIVNCLGLVVASKLLRRD